MNYTRIDTKKLKAAVAAAEKKLDEVDAHLDALPQLTDEQRAELLRPRADFPKAGRKLAAKSGEHGDLVAATEYDAEAVLEDLDNVDVIEELGPRLARLARRVDDARLLWLAEAYVPTLEFYGVARVRAKKDAVLAQTIAPLAAVMATPRAKAATK
jgi:hypothetical protein